MKMAVHTHRYFRDTKGITLIALVITIIVMLILVGVTINVVINGELIKKSQDAKTKQEQAIQREQLQSAVWAAINNETGNVDFDKVSLLGWTSELWSDGSCIYTCPKGYKFRVKSNGEIKDYSDEEYIPRESLEGKYVNFDANNDGEIANDGSELYIVLYDDRTHGLQIISANTLDVNNLYLGWNDPTVTEEEIEEIDEKIGLTDSEKEELASINGNNALTEFETAVASYNKLVATINNACRNLVTNPKAVSVRSVGSNPINPDSENTELYESVSSLNNLPTEETNYGVLKGKLNGIAYSEDNNYEEDVNKIINMGIVNNGKNYFVASRHIYDTYSPWYACFSVRIIQGKTLDITGVRLWYAGNGKNSTKDVYSRADLNYGVRPVVTLNYNALNNVTGEGTKDSPYEMK